MTQINDAIGTCCMTSISIGMVRVRSWEMLYVYESPHRNRGTRMCVHVCVCTCVCRCTIDLSLLSKEQTHKLELPLEEGEGVLVLLVTLTASAAVSISDLSVNMLDDPHERHQIMQRYVSQRLRKMYYLQDLKWGPMAILKYFKYD